jgi:Cu(I)/Ag(I) efflux system periplasmic protein CusF
LSRNAVRCGQTQNPKPTAAGKHVDAASGVVTLKHGGLTNIGAPVMAMVSQEKDSTSINSVKEGDNLNVRIENLKGTLTIVMLAKW